MTTKATLVPDDQRMDTGPRIFKNVNHWLAFENTVYNQLSNLSKDYDGGYWEFYTLSNGGFFMAPNTGHLIHLGPLENYFDKDVSAEAAGIIACLYAYSHLSFEIHNSEFGEMYHMLLEFVYEHPEGRLIMGAID